MKKYAQLFIDIFPVTYKYSLHHLIQTYILNWTELLLYSNIYPTRCNVTQFILFGICSTYFGWYHHSSSGGQTTVFAASDICHTVTATCPYRRGVGTGLSVLCTA